MFETNDVRWFQLSYRTVKTGFIDPETEKEKLAQEEREKRKKLIARILGLIGLYKN